MPQEYTKCFPLSKEGVNLIAQVSNCIVSLETAEANVKDRITSAKYLRRWLIEFRDHLANHCFAPSFQQAELMEQLIAQKIVQIGGDTSVNTDAAPRLPPASPTPASPTFAPLRPDQFA